MLKDIIRAILPTWNKILYSFVVWLLFLIVANAFLFPCREGGCHEIITTVANFVYPVRNYLFVIFYLITGFSNL